MKTVVDVLIAFRKKSEYLKYIKLVRDILLSDSSFFCFVQFLELPMLCESIYGYFSCINMAQFLRLTNDYTFPTATRKGMYP